MKLLWSRLITILFITSLSFTVLGLCTVTGEELSPKETHSSTALITENSYTSADYWPDDSSMPSDASSDDSSLSTGASTDGPSLSTGASTYESSLATGAPTDDSSPSTDASTDDSSLSSDVSTDDSDVSTMISMEETDETTIPIDSYETTDIENAAIETVDYAFYTGKPICPKPVISYQDILLTENADYTLEYSNNINPGTASIKVQGINRYSGNVTLSFTIVNVKLSTRSKSYDYTGHVRKPTALLSGTPYSLKNEVDYTVSYKNNRKCGSGTLTVSGIGKWYGSLSCKFNVSLKKLMLNSVTSPKNQQMVASWTSDPCVTGYQLRYDINGQKKAVKIPGGNRKAKTLSQLPKDAICKVDVRSYLEQDGKTFYSSWSDAMSVKIRYRYWNVTQYESVTGNQAMIYAITDRYNRLVLIDGGYTQDAKLVRSIIKKYHNCVYAWILTHPHPDHIGAFNAIMANNKDIKVNRIFATKVNSKRYRETARSYDDIATYDRFCKIARNLKNVTYLQENDTFSVWGLSFKVLHGWDSNVNNLNSHLCNDGSLMFKISGATKSMLFCSDTQREMQKFIYPNHKSELKSDYVQCGHHGNQGLTNYFYSLVDADVAFMDAPPWLLRKNGNYDAYLLKDYLESKGTKVYRYDGKTHTIKII